jgi:hypothetical protein
MVRRVLVAIEMPAAAVPIADQQQQQQQLHSQPSAQSQAQTQSKEPQADDLPVSRIEPQDEKTTVAAEPQSQSAEMQALQTERAALLQKLQGANEAIEVRNYCVCYLYLIFFQRLKLCCLCLQWMKAREKDVRASLATPTIISTGTQSAPTPAIEVSAELQALQLERAELLQKLQGANEAIEVSSVACLLFAY